MSQTTQDLWPDDIAVVGDLKPPLIILREQAMLLGQKTNNIVEGNVVTQPATDEYFNYTFILHSPILSYSYALFRITHPLELYPVTIVSDDYKTPETANNEEEFIEELKKVFSAEKTKRIIAALIAQAQSPIAA